MPFIGAAPQCEKLPPGRLPAADTLPVFHVLAGAEPRGQALCESNSSNAVVLRALCAATKGCGAFTVGSGGGEPGDLPPHTCRGSRLYAAAALAANATGMAKSGVDLFVLGPALPSAINSLTPKAASQVFPAKPTTVSIDRGSFKFLLGGGSASNTVLTDALRRYTAAVWTDVDERDDRAPSMAAGACTAIQITISNASDHLTADVDESYNLTIAAGTATLSATTCWGALHGLQTSVHTTGRALRVIATYF